MITKEMLAHCKNINSDNTKNHKEESEITQNAITRHATIGILKYILPDCLSAGPHTHTDTCS